MKLFFPNLLLVFLVLLAACSPVAVPEYEYEYDLANFEPDVLAYDQSRPNDLRNIAATLRIFEIAPSERRDFIQSRSQLSKEGNELYIPGDGAQSTISIFRLADAPFHSVKIRVVLGTPISETMTVYLLERGDGGWKLLLREHP